MGNTQKSISKIVCDTLQWAVLRIKPRCFPSAEFVLVNSTPAGPGIPGRDHELINPRTQRGMSQIVRVA